MQHRVRSEDQRTECSRLQWRFAPFDPSPSPSPRPRVLVGASPDHSLTQLLFSDTKAGTPPAILRNPVYFGANPAATEHKPKFTSCRIVVYFGQSKC